MCQGGVWFISEPIIKKLNFFTPELLLTPTFVPLGLSIDHRYMYFTLGIPLVVCVFSTL